MWRTQGNRVSKTRFINQKNFKSQVFPEIPQKKKKNLRNPRELTSPRKKKNLRNPRESSPHLARWPRSGYLGPTRWCGGGVVKLDRAAMGSLVSSLMRRWGGVNGL